MQIENDNLNYEAELAEIFKENNDNKLNNSGVVIATIEANKMCRRQDFSIPIPYMLLQTFNRTEGAGHGHDHNGHTHSLVLSPGDKVLVGLINGGKTAVVIGKLG